MRYKMKVEAIEESAEYLAYEKEKAGTTLLYRLYDEARPDQYSNYNVLEVELTPEQFESVKLNVLSAWSGK